MVGGATVMAVGPKDAYVTPKLARAGDHIIITKGPAEAAGIFAAMHDATECGIWGGVYELAQAAGLGVVLDKDAIVVDETAVKINNHFGIGDTYAAISEGTLILSCKANRSSLIIQALTDKGIPASVAGELTPSDHGLKVVQNGKEGDFKHPRVDPFWNAFYAALSPHRQRRKPGIPPFFVYPNK